MEMHGAHSTMNEAKNRRAIRIVSPGLSGGGSERVCVRLANHWAAQGIAVELLLIRDGGEFRSSLTPGVRVRLANQRRIRLALPWLIKECWRSRQTPLLAFGCDVGVALGLLKRSGLVRSPVIYREWNLPEVNVRASRLWIYPQAIAHLDAAIAQTRYAAESLRRLGLNNRPILQCANPVEPIALGERRTVAAGEELRILSVGRLSAQKRFDRLIRALSAWRATGGRFRLCIAGDGEARSDLKRLTAALGLDGKVSFLGWVGNIAAAYHSSDLFVLPSAYEGMPNALLEAILAGCRVLSSGGEGVRELMNALGLEACYLEDADFGLNFGAKIDQALALEDDRWIFAERTLREITNIQHVAARYFAFCSEVGHAGRSDNF